MLVPAHTHRAKLEARAAAERAASRVSVLQRQHTIGDAPPALWRGSRLHVAFIALLEARTVLASCELRDNRWYRAHVRVWSRRAHAVPRHA